MIVLTGYNSGKKIYIDERNIARIGNIMELGAIDGVIKANVHVIGIRTEVSALGHRNCSIRRRSST